MSSILRKRASLSKANAEFRMMKAINGSLNGDATRPYYMDRPLARETLEAWKLTMHNPLSDDDLDGQMAKNVTIATGLTYYDLRAPALNLFPTVTPLRNSMPRIHRPNPGDALHWKSVLATVGSGFPFMGWVPEGQRTASMSYQTSNNTLPYATLGEEDSITEEARYAAQGFEDEDALVQLRLLLKMFVKEEAAILGGNYSLTLAVPGTITTSASGTGGTLPAATYSVYVVALTQEGYLQATAPTSNTVGNVPTTITINGNDGKTYVLSGGSSNKGTNTLQAITLGQNLLASVPPVVGAAAYAWFIGTVGNETLQAITTLNTLSFGLPLYTSQQPATTITSDHSNNTTAYNGLLTTAFLAGSNAYVNTLATVAGTGTQLTSSGAGSVNEIDAMLLSMWNNYRISPTVLYVNAQELKSITHLVLNGTSAPLLRYQVNVDDAAMAEYKLTAAGTIAFYFNPFTADGGTKIPVKIHPNLSPGTILAWAETLPPWYVSNSTPEVAAIYTRMDYYNEVWPKTTRAQFYGIYCQSALGVHAPFATGIINNIAPTP